jgi:hypothetical protein
MNEFFTGPGGPLSGLETVKVEGLSQILGRSPATIRTQLSRAPGRVPPHLPGSWPKVWRLVTVLEWLDKQDTTPTGNIAIPKKGPGRPRRG